MAFDLTWASQVVLVVKTPPASAEEVRDVGSIPGLGRSPGGGNGNHSCIPAWRIPWTEEPDGYSPWGHKGLDTTEHALSTHAWRVLPQEHW